ncbi:MAG: sulfate permease [Rhizobiales bacterium]|nr:sulfate permease [Hyphomicrobiales bacterium]
MNRASKTTVDSEPEIAQSRSSARRILDLIPALRWTRQYRWSQFSGDLTAAIIVTIMLIPQSLAYAMLAGLPPEIGLYASILPLVAYALFGTSRTLAVGPVAIVSLMTATAASSVAAQGSAEYLAAAILLAALSGIMLAAMGLFRLGFIANFLSHPVIAGFIASSGILIAVGQLRHLLGISAGGQTLQAMLASLGQHIAEINGATATIGILSLAALVLARRYLKSALAFIGMPPRAADAIARSGPVFVVIAATLAVAGFALKAKGVAVVGAIPAGLPPIALPGIDLDLVLQLVLPAFMISLVGFVESVSVGQTLAAKRRQRIEPNQELIGLGVANIASAICNGFPVTGGFARSVVNFGAGAETPAAGAFAAVGIALATLYLTPYLADLPQATLAATIIVAVLSLVDFSVLRRTWNYSKADFAAMAATMLITLAVGVEQGILAGVALSLALFLYRTSRPHMAIVGLVPGTEHFRNIRRHDVLTSEEILTLRIDESLYFANSRYLEDRITELVADRPRLRHLILMCSAINDIDASALESLEEINRRLADGGVTLHLSEVKGPVMDRLAKTSFLKDLTGKVFRSQFDAIAVLDPSVLAA